MKRFYFTLHDEGGRVIERFGCTATSYAEAYAAAEQQTASICSHGITQCDRYWRPS